LSTLQDVTKQKYQAKQTKLDQLARYVQLMADEDFDYVTELPDGDDDPGAWSKDGVLDFLNGVVSTAIKSNVCTSLFILSCHNVTCRCWLWNHCN
jgi:hypothetical protein